MLSYSSYRQHVGGSMKLRFLKACVDKYTGVHYNIGDEVDFEEARAKEILRTDYAEEVIEVAVKEVKTEKAIKKTKKNAKK